MRISSATGQVHSCGGMLTHDPRETCQKGLLRVLQLGPDTVAGKGMGIEVGACLIGENGDDGRASELGERSVDLVARE